MISYNKLLEAKNEYYLSKLRKFNMGYMTAQRMKNEFLNATGAIYKRKIKANVKISKAWWCFNPALSLYLYSILPLVNFSVLLNPARNHLHFVTPKTSHLTSYL